MQNAVCGSHPDIPLRVSAYQLHGAASGDFTSSLDRSAGETQLIRDQHDMFQMLTWELQEHETHRRWGEYDEDGVDCCCRLFAFTEILNACLTQPRLNLSAASQQALERRF